MDTPSDNLKLLAIDDNQDNLTTLTAVMRGVLPECTLLTASSVPQSIELAHIEDPDVILLDIVMSGMDGFAICRKLKEDDFLQAIPVLFLTAFRTDRDSRVKALAAGAAGFLYSPFDEVELVAQFRAMAKIKAANRVQRLENGRLAALVIERTRELESELAEPKLAEAAVRASEAKYRRLHQSIMDAFVSVGMDGKVQEFNDVYRQMLGYEPGELTALTYVDLTPSRWHAFEAEIVRKQILPRGYSDTYEKEYRRKDGTIFPVELRTFLIADDDGKPAAMWAIVRDITERKRAEVALREIEERYRAVLDDQTEVICRFKADGTYTFVNDVFCRLFGKTSAELLGKKWQPVVVPEDVPMVEERLRTLTPANPVVVIENRVYSGSGEVRWMQFVNRAFFDAAGLLLETQSVGRDITERKQVEEKLHESAAAARARADELATELAATPALTFIAHDPDCLHMTSSRAALRLLGLPADANSSKSAPPGERSDTFRAMKDGRELPPEELPVQLAAATGQTVKDFELTLALADGTARDIVGDAVPLFDAEGKVRGAVGAFLDITGRGEPTGGQHATRTGRGPCRNAGRPGGVGQPGQECLPGEHEP